MKEQVCCEGNSSLGEAFLFHPAQYKNHIVGSLLLSEIVNSCLDAWILQRTQPPISIEAHKYTQPLFHIQDVCFHVQTSKMSNWKVFGFVGQILHSLMSYAFLLNSALPLRLKFV